MMQGQNKGLFGQVIVCKCDASQSVLNGRNQACRYGEDECKHQEKHEKHFLEVLDDDDSDKKTKNDKLLSNLLAQVCIVFD